MYRRSVFGRLGYCGTDRRRSPLRGDELRACWRAPDTTPIVLFAAEAGQPLGR